ncbi:MAG: alpha/beta fold hydrolase [Chloroflexi bacterium]|nr:alpha/beta fold hydrolase [Chloroflexota bacterium]
MKKTLLFLAFLLLVTACTRTEPTVSATETPAGGSASRLARLGGVPCPDGEFTCVTVSVPLDHFNPQDKRAIDVVFGVLPAGGERKGMFVTAVGGPGGSGLLSADNYTSYFDPSITEHFDIVFFDQRGIGQSGGQSGGLQCAQAAADFYRADTDATTPAGEEHLLDVSQTFVNDCVDEMGKTDLLPYLDTAQAVEDLETFRELMGDDKFWLYGESYGTQFAQTYTASHPDRLAGLVLDGVVDLTLSDTDFLKGQAQAFNDVLVATLEACNEDEACAEAMGRDAAAVYDELAAQLKQAPMSFGFPLSTGEVERREFTFPDLEATSGFLYSETARMMFLRALAFYARDENLVPLARVVYNSLYLDPDTLAAIPDPSYSDAIYYGVTCRDYPEPGNTPEERALNFIKAGDEMDTSLPRLASIFYGDLPCVFWPHPQEDQSLPTPLTADGIPTLVLNGTTDPATPYSGAQAVYSRLADGYLVTETGGPHVIFGWGNECVDGLVTDFLVEDELPAERETVCDGVVADEFISIAPVNAADFASPLEALASVDDEINYLPEYYYMGYTIARGIACPFGGTLTFDSTETGDAFTFTDCAFSGGFTMTGEGAYNCDDELFTLEVTVTGLKDGTLTYTRDSEGTLHVTGEYGGETIDITE